MNHYAADESRSLNVVLFANLHDLSWSHSVLTLEKRVLQKWSWIFFVSLLEYKWNNLTHWIALAYQPKLGKLNYLTQ